MKHLLFIIFAIFFLIVISILLAPTFEGFVNQTPNVREQLNTSMTILSESLCPALKALIDDEKLDIQRGSDTKKEEEALLKITREAGGALFTCPPANNPLEIQANIGDRIQTTITFLEPKLKGLLDKITKSLDCPKIEGFEIKTCNTTELEKRKTLELDGAIKEAQKICKLPSELSELEKNQIYKTRADAIARILSNKKFTQKLANIKTYTRQLQKLKNDAEAGRLKPNCAV